MLDIMMVLAAEPKAKLIALGVQAHDPNCDFAGGPTKCAYLEDGDDVMGLWVPHSDPNEPRVTQKQTLALMYTGHSWLEAFAGLNEQCGQYLTAKEKQA